MGKRKTPLPFPESGSLIKRYREKSGYTQEKLAEKVGVSKNYIGDIETGQKMAGIKLLDNIAREFGVSIEDLLRYRTSEDEMIRRRIYDLTSRIESTELAFVYEAINNTLATFSKYRIMPIDRA